MCVYVWALALSEVPTHRSVLSVALIPLAVAQYLVLDFVII